MARKRMIDPNFWRDEKLSECSFMERLLFQGLWTFAEDSGVGRANPILIKADIFPYDNLKPSDIEKSLKKLADLGLVLLYEIDGQKYYFIKNFLKHQTINKPSKCSLPLPLPEHYGSTTGVLRSQEKLSKEEVEVKEKISKGEIESFFESLWKLYPKKEGKGQISDTQKAKLYDLGYSTIENCINRYKADKEGTEYQFLKNGSTFFNSGYVDYLDENYEPKPKDSGNPFLNLLQEESAI